MDFDALLLLPPNDIPSSIYTFSGFSSQPYGIPEEINPEGYVKLSTAFDISAVTLV
jgi:hypothetical protein